MNSAKLCCNGVRFQFSAYVSVVFVILVLVLGAGCADRQLQLNPEIHVSPASSTRPALCSVFYDYVGAKTDRLRDNQGAVWVIPLVWWWTKVYDPQHAHTTSSVLRDQIAKGLLDSKTFARVATWDESQDRAKRGAMLLTLSCEGGGYRSTYTHYGIGILAPGLVILAGSFVPLDYGARVEVNLAVTLTETETGKTLWGPTNYLLTSGSYTRPWWWSSGIPRKLSKEMNAEIERVAEDVISKLDGALPPEK